MFDILPIPKSRPKTIAIKNETIVAPKVIFIPGIINLKDSNETIKFYVKQNLINNTHYFLKKNKLVLNQEFFSQPHEVVFRALSDSIK